MIKRKSSDSLKVSLVSRTDFPHDCQVWQLTGKDCDENSILETVLIQCIFIMITILIINDILIAIKIYKSIYKHCYKKPAYILV